MKAINKSVWKKYGYAWVTLGLFLMSLTLHWGFAWSAYLNESEQHGQEPQVNEYVVETMRDTMENWQSEFLQLIWQVAGLAYLLYLGSPQSKEGDERLEEKVDYLIEQIAKKDGETFIKAMNAKYPQS